MKLWRALLSVHYRNGARSSVIYSPTFYVHACTAQEARSKAVLVVNATDITGVVGTSGTVIAVDSDLDPDETTYHSWSNV